MIIITFILLYFVSGMENMDVELNSPFTKNRNDMQSVVVGSRSICQTEYYLLLLLWFPFLHVPLVRAALGIRTTTTTTTTTPYE